MDEVASPEIWNQMLDPSPILVDLFMVILALPRPVRLENLLPLLQLPEEPLGNSASTDIQLTQWSNYHRRLSCSTYG